jgi:hypothetical protein
MRTRIQHTLTMLICLAYAPWSMAALGAGPDSVDADQLHFKSERRDSVQSGYQTHELTSPTGTVVREYTDATGHVFAVSWRGSHLPDLRQLLGVSYMRFTAAAQIPHGGHTALLVHDNDLVIESTGRMRSFAGRAYLPGAMPIGVAQDAIH